jgi:hypothetical protein
MEPDEQARREGWLRRNARKQGLTATKDGRDGLWRFMGGNSRQAGGPMTLEEAELWLQKR